MTIWPVIAIVMSWSSEWASRSPASATNVSQPRRSRSEAWSRARSAARASESASRCSSTHWSSLNPSDRSDATASAPITRPSADTGTITIDRAGEPRRGATWVLAPSAITTGRWGLRASGAPASPAATRVPRTESGSPLTATTSNASSTSWPISRYAASASSASRTRSVASGR